MGYLHKTYCNIKSVLFYLSLEASASVGTECIILIFLTPTQQIDKIFDLSSPSVNVVQNNLYYFAYNAMSSNEPLLQTNGYSFMCSLYYLLPFLSPTPTNSTTRIEKMRLKRLYATGLHHLFKLNKCDNLGMLQMYQQKTLSKNGVQSIIQLVASKRRVLFDRVKYIKSNNSQRLKHKRYLNA